MAKDKPKAPKPDYQALWRTYDRWQQEDRMWYERAKAEQEKGSDIAAAKARMSASGLKAGSAAWDRQLKEVLSQREDIDKTYAEKQQKLQESLVYQDLQKAYQQSERVRRGRESTQFVKDWEKQLRPDFGQEGFKRELSWNELEALGFQKDDTAIGKGRPSDRQVQLRLGNLMEEQNLESLRMQQIAGGLGYEFSQMDFQKWGETTFGSEKAKNPYAAQGPSAEEKALARAKLHAGGRARGKGAGTALEALQETSPWI